MKQNSFLIKHMKCQTPSISASLSVLGTARSTKRSEGFVNNTKPCADGLVVYLANAFPSSSIKSDGCMEVVGSYSCASFLTMLTE